MISFLLNEQRQEVDNIDPNTSVLDYLRDNLHQTGTKEGCASGDCGACTVVLAEHDNENPEQLSYNAINACITPIGHLHGKQLITVEHLKHQGQLHPVQQVMVDEHASQCGFCTPGFVMSMFALAKKHPTQNEKVDREQIIEALGGNLCRCTGYRPIIDAAIKMFDPTMAPLNDHFTINQHHISQQLQQINQQTSEISLHSENKHYLAPKTTADLASLLITNPKARLVAGATDLGLEFTQMLNEIDCLIYTGQVDELKNIVIENDNDNNVLIIGAAVTFNQAKNCLVEHFPALQELIERLGSYQIRNQATLAGNIGNASPIGDFPPVLIALGAQLQLRLGEQRRIVNVEDYFIGYKTTILQTSEFIEHILIPIKQKNSEFQVYKISKRFEDDISATCGAFNFTFAKSEQGEEFVQAATIAFGGMAEIPKRAKHTESALINQPWCLATIEQAMLALELDFSPISDFRASKEYRLQVSKNLLKRFYLERASTEIAVRFTHA